MAMSEEHKAALARGRKEARAIEVYLSTLKSRKPGRAVTKESLETRRETVNSKLKNEHNSLKTVKLIQTKLDIEEAIDELKDAVGMDELEAHFIEHVESYSERKGISYTAWRDFGVRAATLKRAGLPYTRRR